jgi:hypothetical protein
MGHSSRYSCQYNLTCTSASSGVNTTQLPCETTMGDLRALAAKEMPTYPVWQRAENGARQQAQQLGTVYRPVYGVHVEPKLPTDAVSLRTQVWGREYIRAHYDIFVMEFKQGQKVYPLFPAVPDGVRICMLVPLEPLHCMIQVLNHQYAIAAQVWYAWGKGKGWRKLTGVKGSESNLKNMLKMFSAAIPFKSMRRPMMGFAGDRLNQLLARSEEWLTAAFTNSIEGVEHKYGYLEVLLTQWGRLDQLMHALWATGSTRTRLCFVFSLHAPTDAHGGGW